MIVCPNCNHQNPDGAVQCEACYTPLPSMMACPNCNASVQTDAAFCGQCGTNLKAVAKAAGVPVASPDVSIPDLPPPDPLVLPDPLMVSVPSLPEETAMPITPPSPPLPPPTPVTPPVLEPQPTLEQPAIASNPSATRLQIQVARLLHIQTNALIELPANLPLIHIGKPNDRIPPDIDVSGFPDSEIVSRVHADIRLEGDAYYIEDVGSSNGTYVNNTPLPMGNRHRLRPGDRIGLGKGDKVSFLFQLS